MHGLIIRVKNIQDLLDEIAEMNKVGIIFYFQELKKKN